MKKLLILGIVGAVFLALAYFFLFSAPKSKAETETFVSPLGFNTLEAVKKLKDQGFIRNQLAFTIALRGRTIKPGGYEISKSMNAWKLAEAIEIPLMEWVVIPEGLRKEQTAEIISKTLSWTDQQKEELINSDSEGMYFPDTYLLPKNETSSQIAERLISKFNEKFQPFAEGFVKENIKWTTALKIASLIQREAGGKEDMPLIAGVIWNRLLLKPPMKLDIDATIQYALGKPGDWWPKITKEDYKTDSPYNTYTIKGLPPSPICNPGLDAIEAVLNPAETECLYYLHDPQGQIHCAKTYKEHKTNIEKYLK